MVSTSFLFLCLDEITPEANARVLPQRSCRLVAGRIVAARSDAPTLEGGAFVVSRFPRRMQSPGKGGGGVGSLVYACAGERDGRKAPNHAQTRSMGEGSPMRARQTA
jgi:hypothetical protein